MSAALREAGFGVTQMLERGREGRVYVKSLKGECVRVTAMTDLEEARHLINQYVEENNTQRLYSALNYLTTVDYLQGTTPCPAAAV